MIGAWLVANPARTAALALIAALIAGLGIRTWQLRSAEATVAHQVEVITTMRAAVALQNAAVADLEAAAAAARKRSTVALEQARAASALREPAIAALAAAEQAGGALTCGDAVERVRDGLR